MQRYYTCRHTGYRSQKQEDRNKLDLHFGKGDESKHTHYLRAAYSRALYNVAVKSHISKESYNSGKCSDRNTFYDKGSDYIRLCRAARSQFRETLARLGV